MDDRVYHGGAENLRTTARIELLEVERVVEVSLEKLSIGSVLDVGAGSAVFAEAFAKKGLKVAGIDINEEMVDAAKRLLPAGDFKVGSAEKIPYDGGAFDLVFLGHVLHETDDKVATLSEARRVAGKRVVVLEWPHTEENIGPPLAHRLRTGQIIESAYKAGLAKVEVVALKHMSLYVMDISGAKNHE
jgi:ubiquinone/menaquinone biosynthesis C-methylase UbiE